MAYCLLLAVHLKLWMVTASPRRQTWRNPRGRRRRTPAQRPRPQLPRWCASPCSAAPPVRYLAACRQHLGILLLVAGAWSVYRARTALRHTIHSSRGLCSSCACCCAWDSKVRRPLWRAQETALEPRLAKFMRLIFDANTILTLMKENNIDTKKMVSLLVLRHALSAFKHFEKALPARVTLPPPTRKSRRRAYSRQAGTWRGDACHAARWRLLGGECRRCMATFGRGEGRVLCAPCRA